MIAGHVGGVRRSLLRGEGSPFARSAETKRSGTLPRQNVAVHVGDGDDRVVKGGLHVAQPMRNVLALLLFERLLLAFFLRRGCRAARCCWFCHKFALSSWLLAPSSRPKAKSGKPIADLRFCRRFLLLRDRSLARAFPRASIGMRSLS